jgi:hypothetical protein
LIERATTASRAGRARRWLRVAARTIAAGERATHGGRRAKLAPGCAQALGTTLREAARRALVLAATL